MNICLDTRLLEEIAGGNVEQKEWIINILKNTGTYIFMPTISIAEFVSVSLKRRNMIETKSLLEWLGKTNIIKMRLSSQIAVGAGKIQYNYRFGIGDSVIIATALHCKCKYIRTDQKEFEKVKAIKTFF